MSFIAVSQEAVSYKRSCVKACDSPHELLMLMDRRTDMIPPYAVCNALFMNNARNLSVFGIRIWFSVSSNVKHTL
jgi:hypothetical protein